MYGQIHLIACTGHRTPCTNYERIVYSSPKTKTASISNMNNVRVWENRTNSLVSIAIFHDILFRIQNKLCAARHKSWNLFFHIYQIDSHFDLCNVHDARMNFQFSMSIYSFKAITDIVCKNSVMSNNLKIYIYILTKWPIQEGNSHPRRFQRSIFARIRWTKFNSFFLSRIYKIIIATPSHLLHW